MAGFFFHGRQKTQGQKNSSHEKTQALFQPETQGTGGFFQNPGKKLNVNIIFWTKVIRKRQKVFSMLKKWHFYEFIAKIWRYCYQISPINVKTDEICAKTQAIPKKLKQIPKKTSRFFQKKNQGTGGFSLFDPPKKRDKKSLD